MDNKLLDKYVLQYMHGDSQAFDVIYAETKETVFLSIYTIIKNRAIIEDLMQDTYMKIIDSLTSYRTGTNFSAWAARIARNTAINYYNKQKREVLVEDDSYEFNKLITTNKTDSVLDTALSCLQGVEKAIFIYRIIYNYTLKDVAKIVDMPLSSVNYIYQNTLKKIKKEVVGINL